MVGGGCWASGAVGRAGAGARAGGIEAAASVPPAEGSSVPSNTLLNTPLTVLGVDPGSLVTGYGVVRVVGADVRLITCGAIRLPDGPVAGRLLELYERLRDLIKDWAPDEVAVEEPFTRVNARSAFVLGKAQATALLAAAHAGLPIHEYTPAAVKQSVAGWGRSGKEQVAEMVRLQFGLAVAPQPADAADALAVALCHIAQRRMRAMTAARPAVTKRRQRGGTAARRGAE